MMTDKAQPRTILYIEDNAANRQLMEMIIERRTDLNLIVAEDGQTGLRLAEEQQPELILLDNSLPDMDGHEVLARLRANERTRAIPVISLSGNSLIVPGATETPAFDGYLTKPIDILKFYATIDHSLRT